MQSALFWETGRRDCLDCAVCVRLPDPVKQDTLIIWDLCWRGSANITE